ncbi:hypothetical protein O988_08728 [Pseudogymnoascus sp. VKM F-3808]|nr:hypothetical protein O988_08728 [Pseudogymnoascus sp. VKM F-3808]
MAEPHIKQDPYIKRDPDAIGASPASFADSEAFEDAGDLEFSTDPNFQNVYLARVPKYLWEQWNDLDDDAEIRLGTVRKTVNTNSDGVSLTMLLRPDLAQHQAIPKEFSLDITAETVNNTFVFTEQDLPGFKSKSRKGFDPATANLPARLTRPKFDKPTDKQPWDPKKRFQPYFKRAIPKKTTLAGRVAHEINCVPVDNPETNRLLAQRTLAAMQPRNRTVFLSGTRSREAGFIQPGTIRAQEAFGGFIKNTGQVKSKSGQDTKTARMPQNELLDLIFQCFKEYNFWSMKALRAKLQQPEAYLRETLEKVADMPRSGRFAMHWTLKKEYKMNIDESTADAAPETEELEDSEMADIDDDEDDDLKFEDVA